MIDASSPESLEATLDAMAAAYVPGAIVCAAMDLRLFDELATPIDAEALASRVGATAEGVRRLLCALVALGLVERKDDGRFWCEHAATLASDRPDAPSATFRHHRRHIAPLLRRLPEAIRTGTPQHDAWSFVGKDIASSAYEELARHPAEYELFLRAMDRASRGVGRRIASVVELRGCGRLLDLGGGGGAVARELLRCVPELVVESVDLEPAAAFAQRRAQEAGLAERHRVHVADVRRPLELAPAPVVLLSAVLADFPPEERERVMHVAASAVAPGGRLLVSETLLSEDRTAPASATVLSLLTLTAFGGGQLGRDELRGLLADVGFHESTLHPGAGGGRDLVVAERASPR